MHFNLLSKKKYFEIEMGIFVISMNQNLFEHFFLCDEINILVINPFLQTTNPQKMTLILSKQKHIKIEESLLKRV